MSSIPVPNTNVAFLGPDNQPTLPWRRFFQSLAPLGTGGGGGTPGPAGPIGPPGPQGVPGPSSSDEFSAFDLLQIGDIGLPGAIGPQGVQGPPGWDGADGEDGSPGPPGAAGVAGAQGAIGPAGVGLVGWDGEDADAWVIPGQQGVAGATGATGPAGAAGLAGIGVPGWDGEADDGWQGPPGILPAGGLSAMIDEQFGSAQGDILYRGASQWTVLSPGNLGQFLETQGSAANPTWATVAAGSVYSAPAIASFTWVNQGGATATQTATGGSILMQIPLTAAGALQVRGLFIAQPSTPYKLIAQTRGRFDYSNSQGAGVFFYDGTKLIDFETLVQANTTGVTARVVRYTNVTTQSAVQFSYGPESSFHNMANVSNNTWYQLRNDGTTLNFDFSLDGVNFVNAYSESVGTFITPTQIGWGGFNANAAGNVYHYLLNWNTKANANLDG